MMNYTETGFRALYHRFAAFTLTDQTRKYLQGFPGWGNANCMLVWGYIDREEGLMLEVITAGLKKDDGFWFADANESVRSTVPVEVVKDAEFSLFGEEVTEACSRRFEKKLTALKQYDVSDEIEQTRQMTFLDEARDPRRIDDVLVYLTRYGYEPEGCLVRIGGLGDNFLVGVLIDEPRQDFGFHQGERVAFRLQKLSDGSMICRADLTPSRKLTKEDLADGTILAEAIRVFNADRTQKNLIEVLELLRDSDVWIPCNAILSDADAAEPVRLLTEAEAGGGAQSLTGQEFENQDEIRLLPDLLKSGDALFLPVFSSIAEMGAYGEPFSKISSHLPDAIDAAGNYGDDLAGIVVNPFSESFVLKTELYDLVKNMKSRIES